MNALTRAAVALAGAMQSSDPEMLVIYAASARSAIAETKQQLVELEMQLLDVEDLIKAKHTKELAP